MIRILCMHVWSCTSIRIQTVQNSLTTFEQHMLPCVNCKQMLFRKCSLCHTNVTYKMLLSICYLKNAFCLVCTCLPHEKFQTQNMPARTCMCLIFTCFSKHVQGYFQNNLEAIFQITLRITLKID